MRRVTDHATLAERFMFINERTALGGMALETGLILTQESEAAALDRLLQVGPPTFYRRPLVRVMAVRATHPAFEHRMTMRQLKLRPHFLVTLKASLGRFSGIDNRVRRAAALDMQAPRPMARLTADVLGVLARSFQARVGRGAEVARYFLMTFGAFFRADELRAGDLRRSNNATAAIQALAGKKDHAECEGDPGAPK